jgi:hypothetical protein
MVGSVGEGGLQLESGGLDDCKGGRHGHGFSLQLSTKKKEIQPKQIKQRNKIK